MIYGVFGGCYSDWYIVGYFNNRLDADKFCCVCGDGEYYVEEMENLQGQKDLSKVSLKYDHEILFDYKNDNWVMRNEADRYKCYVGEELRPNSIEKGNYGWVKFHINIAKDNRKLAEKIAQDYLYQLLAYGDSKKVYEENVKLMNDKFMEPYRIKEELREQEELKQKELAELDRLKKKYES